MKISKVVKILIFSDSVMAFGWGLLAPVFSIFIIQNIQGADIKTASFAAAIFWIAKSIFQIPIGKYLDRQEGEKDDFYFVVVGTFIVGLVPFGYLLVLLSWHIYLLQFFYGIGIAMTWTAWYAIFTRHINKGREAFEWSLENTALGIGGGIASAVGGIVIANFGFETIFILVGSFTFLSSFLALFIHKYLNVKGDHSLHTGPPSRI